MTTIEVRKLNVVKRINAKNLAAYEEKGFAKVDADDKVVAEKPVAKMNTSELTAKAAELNVDISGAKNNAERAAIITDFIAKQGNE
jgi:hypothetical protein